MTLITSSLESFKKVSRWASLSEYFDKPLIKVCLQEAFEKGVLLEIVKHILGFWVRLLLSWKVVPFLYINALRSFISGKRAWEIKFIIVVKVFSVSCVGFNEMFSLHYGKCILPAYPEWNIKQAWKFNILWASSNTK